jgi:diaminohydroxyphosphoribosylaminopyrimidine deaminase / 5-amino-6-(5-phosphoribosylamino)uracil reductase
MIGSLRGKKCEVLIPDRLMSHQEFADRDNRFMGLAIRYARRGLGTTAPNPSVGAVIVDSATGRVISMGRTSASGRPHAETQAIARAGERARGATMYVTLEPCSHHGRTGPCAEAITRAGLARVVVANTDPDQRVSGRGLAILRAAGIEVVSGVMDAEARWLHAGHLLRVTEGRPFVQLKLAVSADGRIAPGTGGKPVWVTGEQARARGHFLRAQADAILIGRGTEAADDPALTCRLPGMEHRSPQRVVIDARLSISLTSKLVITANAPRTIIMFDPESVPGELAARTAALKKAGVWLVNVRSTGGGWLDLSAVLGGLARLGITRLLVEGGPTVARSFLEQDLVDEAVIFQGTGVLGESGLLPLRDRGLAVFDDPLHWTRTSERRLGPDRMIVYRSSLSRT